MKKILFRVGVLIVAFLAALIIGSLIINRRTEDNIVDMGAPSVPRISFMLGDEEINPLFGYADEMDITAMRDSITPLEVGGILSMKVQSGLSSVKEITYKVYTLGGEEIFSDGKAEIPEKDEVTELKLANVLSDEVQEAVLKIVLKTDENSYSYYTRIVRPDEITTKECLKFAKDFHTKAINKEAAEELSLYLEPNEESDNTTYQTVNIHSDITHIQWGSLAPKVLGDIDWSVKESNTVYTSILAKYQVSCENDDGVPMSYNIKEFFRIRVVEGTVYLLDYNRDMQQVFDGMSGEFDKDGIDFGIISNDLPFEVNKDGTKTAFVQERNLWLYDSEDGELIKIFSFADQEGQDVRSRNDQHAVRIISMDNKGNIAFGVYGYMNRGLHEGQVGVGIYYYNVDDNIVEEKAFIPSDKSFAIAEDELGKMVYYNHSQMMLYVLADGTLYQVDLDKDEQTTLAEDLTTDQYAVSDDGHLMAYQTKDKESGSTEICVMNLKDGESYEIKAEKGEKVTPLGFINDDFIYGKTNPDDSGHNISGEEITPMYEIEIRNADNKEEAKYNFTDQNIYTTDIIVDGNLLTINRVVKDGDVYNSTKQEYVTNNKEREETVVSLEQYSTEKNGTQVYLAFENGIEDTEPTVKKPEQLAEKEPLTIKLSDGQSGEKYYVYGIGELVAVYDKAAYAIQKAEQVSGVVISSDQTYVWEKGNRDLVYTTDAETFKTEEGETSLEACERYMEKYDANKIDLTGCSLDQVLYVINRGCPLIALTDSNHAVLITGYTTSDITYIDPDTGEENTVAMSDMQSMIENGGNTMIGFVR